MMCPVPARRSRAITIALACIGIGLTGADAHAQSRGAAGAPGGSPVKASATSGAATSGATTSGAATSGATSGAATSGAATSAAPAKGAAATVPAPEPAAQDAARTLFEQAVGAHDAGDLPAAAELFGRAWSQKRSWDIAANLGIVERKLGRFVAAAEHLSYALRALPPSESDETRVGLERELAPALAVVEKLTIRSNVAGAVVRVGNEVKGVTPLEGPVFTAPGGVLVEVTRDGYESAPQSLVAKKHGAHELTFELKPKVVRDERPWTGPAIAFGAGGAGLLTGLVAGSFALVKFGDLKQACGDDLVCPARLRGDIEAGRAAAAASTVGFVFAGLGAAVGVTLIALPIRKTQARVGVRVGPAFVGVKGAF